MLASFCIVLFHVQVGWFFIFVTLPLVSGHKINVLLIAFKVFLRLKMIVGQNEGKYLNETILYIRTCICTYIYMYVFLHKVRYRILLEILF